MPTVAAIPLILLALGVAVLGWRTPIRLWHIVVLSSISIAMVLWTTVGQAQAQWILFGIGLGIGVFALVRSYQYQARVAEEQIQQEEQEWEERWERERAEAEATGKPRFLP
jgi:bacteriorhodopsin